MSPEELRAALGDTSRIESNPFGLLREITRYVNDDTTEETGRELVLRALDQRDAFGAYTEILEALTRQVGLFPYLDPGDLSLRDHIAYEFHRPGVESEIVFHRVQAEVYRRLIDGENVILSAPTSFGKSRIIDAIIASAKHRNIAIIVPTIALIDETRRRLAAFADRYKLITQLPQKAGERNLFVFTAERLVAYEELPRIDFFVIDEFYKIGAFGEDSSRMVALNQAFYRMHKGGGQFYLLGPSIRQIPEGLEDKFRCYFVPTKFATVASEIIRISDWQDDDTKLDRLVEIAAQLTEPTLIFCKSPGRVNEVARLLLERGVGLEVPDLGEASAWVGEKFHPDWIYGTALTRGIGLHHGRLPRSLSQFSVRAFNEEKLRFLVCTSTLIEGVNTRAKNVLILDNVIARRKYDFFTFNNIKGRSGRMFQHFIGHVYLFHEPPTEELPYVDFPFFTQNSDAPESLLVQLDDEDLTDTAKERLTDIHEQSLLPLELIRQNSTIDPAAQIALASHLSRMRISEARAFWWRGLPNSNQLKEATALLWEYFIKRPKNDVFSAAQLTFKLRDLQHSPDVKARALGELRPGRYQAQSADEAVERVLTFDRNWAGFEFPRLLSALSRIQSRIFTDRFGQAGNYLFYAARVEQLFRNPALVALEEYGLPLQVGEKIDAAVRLSENLDTALARVKMTTPEECRLSAFEAELLLDVQKNL